MTRTRRKAVWVGWVGLACLVLGAAACRPQGGGAGIGPGRPDAIGKAVPVDCVAPCVKPTGGK